MSQDQRMVSKDISKLFYFFVITGAWREEYNNVGGRGSEGMKWWDKECMIGIGAWRIKSKGY